VLAAAFSPDGQYVATGEGGKPTAIFGPGRAIVWDASTGKPIGESMSHGGDVEDVAFSSDGKYLATGSRDRTARVWVATTGEPVTPYVRHHDHLRQVAFSGNNRLLLTRTIDGTIGIWDAATGEAFRWSLRPVKQGRLRIHAFRHDGHRVLASLGANVHQWETATGEQCIPVLTHPADVLGAAYSGDGKQILTWSTDHTLRRWNAEAGDAAEASLQCGAVIEAAAFAPDGATVLVKTGNGVLRWNGDRAESFPLVDAKGASPVSFDPGGAAIVARDGDQLRLFNTGSGKPAGPPLEEKFARSATLLAYRADQAQALINSGTTTRLWNAATGEAIGRPLPVDKPIRAAAFLRFPGEVATWAEEANSIDVWRLPLPEPALEGDRRPGQQTHTAPSSLPGGYEEPPFRLATGLQAMAFCSSSGHLLVGLDDDTVQLWLPDERQPEPLLQHPSCTGFAVPISFSTDGRVMVTRSGESERLWDTASREPLGPALPPDVVAIALSTDGRHVLTSTSEELKAETKYKSVRFRLWDVAAGTWHGADFERSRSVAGAMRDPVAQRFRATGQLRHSTSGQRGTAELAGGMLLSPNGRLLLRGNQLWAVETGQSVGPPLPHENTIHDASFRSDGQSLVTAGFFDSTARIWRIPEPLTGDIARVRLWAEILSGMKLNDGPMHLSQPSTICCGLIISRYGDGPI